MQNHCRTGCLLLAVAFFASPLPAVHGQASSPRKCIRQTCRTLKRECISRFKADFRTAKKACREVDHHKACKKVRKQTFRQNREACHNGFMSCRKCCRADQVECNIVNCGDGVKVEGEECDDGNIIDGDGCSARCQAEEPLVACRGECKAERGDCMRAAHLMRRAAKTECKGEMSRAKSLCISERGQCENDVNEARERCRRNAKKCEKRAGKGFEQCREGMKRCMKDPAQTYSRCKKETLKTYRRQKEGCKDTYDACRSNCENFLVPYLYRCLPNEAGGPNLSIVTVAEGGDLDVGWTGLGHNQGVVAGVKVFGCLQNCDTKANAVCSGTGPVGEGSLNGTTLGPPLPMLAADVATCVVSEFAEDIAIRSLNLQTGEIDMRVRLNSIVHLTGNKENPCPTCSGETVGALGECGGVTPSLGRSCTTEGTTLRFGNVSSDCLPFRVDDVGELEIVLDPVTSGTATLQATNECDQGVCPCLRLPRHLPPRMNVCDDPDDCSPEVCEEHGGSDDVREGFKPGIDQACCRRHQGIIPCFINDISRTGRAAVPQPPWPDPGYPKIAEGGEIVSTFCVPETNTHIPIDVYGLPGPGAVLVPVETYVDFSP